MSSRKFFGLQTHGFGKVHIGGYFQISSAASGSLPTTQSSDDFTVTSSATGIYTVTTARIFFGTQEANAIMDVSDPTSPTIVGIGDFGINGNKQGYVTVVCYQQDPASKLFTIAGPDGGFMLFNMVFINSGLS